MIKLPGRAELHPTDWHGQKPLYYCVFCEKAPEPVNETEVAVQSNHTACFWGFDEATLQAISESYLLLLERRKESEVKING